MLGLDDGGEGTDEAELEDELEAVEV